MTTFGTIESIAVVLLLLLVFGSMRPLLLGVMTLALAITAAYTVVHLVFGEVHILALVFGSSLIGSVIDYSIHFFADRFRDPEHWTPASAVPHVGPAILLGLTTTLVGYLVLAAVPFPGLEQIAVFCMTGLVVGCGCVLCLYPVLARARGKLPKFGPARRWCDRSRVARMALDAPRVDRAGGAGRCDCAWDSRVSGFRTTSRRCSNRPRNS